jgi:hypothetical protein
MGASPPACDFGWRAPAFQLPPTHVQAKGLFDMVGRTTCAVTNTKRWCSGP